MPYTISITTTTLPHALAVSLMRPIVLINVEKVCNRVEGSFFYEQCHVRQGLTSRDPQPSLGSKHLTQKCVSKDFFISSREVSQGDMLSPCLSVMVRGAHWKEIKARAPYLDQGDLHWFLLHFIFSISQQYLSFWWN